MQPRCITDNNLMTQTRSSSANRPDRPTLLDQFAGQPLPLDRRDPFR